jgi:hypothetical protein
VWLEYTTQSTGVSQGYFQHDNYSNQQICRALNPPERMAPPTKDPDLISFLPYLGSAFNCLSHPERVAPPTKDPDLISFLPYLGSAFNCLSQMLSWHNTKSVNLPLRISWLLSICQGQPRNEDAGNIQNLL